MSLRMVAESAPGIAAEVRDWLTGMESTLVIDAVEESGLRSLDQVIADVLVRRDDIDRLASGSADAVGDDRALVRTLADAFMDMAKARGLELLTHNTLREAENPTGRAVTPDDVITLYLGYLTDLATTALEKGALRRFECNDPVARREEGRR